MEQQQQQQAQACGTNVVMAQPGQSGGQQQGATQALQQLLQALKKNSESSKAEVLQILKTYPQLMAAFIRHRQIQQQQQQQYYQQQQYQQQQQQYQQQQAQACGTNVVMAQPGQSGGQQQGATQALQQLLQALKKSPGPSKAEVLQILKTHPQLMAAFIRHRQIQQQQQQQQYQQQQQGWGGGIWPGPGVMAQPSPLSQAGGPPGLAAAVGPLGHPGQPGEQPQEDVVLELQQVLEILSISEGSDPHSME